jgi:hypothetical protein
MGWVQLPQGAPPMQCSRSRVARALRSSSALVSRPSVLFASLACTLVFVAQASATRIVLNADDDDGGAHFFTVQIHEADSRHTSGVQNSRVEDRDLYSRKLKFTITNHHPSGSSTTTNVLGGNSIFSNGFGIQDTNKSDPVSTVPEPSSLLLMSAGLFGLGTVLRNRLARRSH